MRSLWLLTPERMDAILTQSAVPAISAEKMAEQIVVAALADKPKPFYARGNNAPVVFFLRRLAPRQLILDITARKHGLGRP